MNFRSVLTVVLGATLALGGCAPGEGTATGPRPADTGFSRAATLALVQADAAGPEQGERLYRQALDQSLQGVEAHPNNPQHFYLAGLAYAGLMDAEGADTMFVRAQEMFPGYTEEIEAAREQGWVQFFNAGVQAFQEGDQQRTIRLWEQANRIYDMRPEAYLNLAAIHIQEGRNDQAIEAYQGALAALDREPTRELTPEEVEDRAESRQLAMANLGQMLLATERFEEAERLFRDYLAQEPGDVTAQSSLALVLARQGRAAEAEQMYQQLLAQPDLDAPGLMSVGVGLFQAEQYQQAAQAFRRVTEMQPNSRDAWYNYTNALYAQNRWQDVIPAAERLVEIDPLNENANLILARAYRELRRNQDALRVLERNEAAPVHVDNLQLRSTEQASIVRGTVQPKAASAGTPVRLRFTFFDAGRELGTQTVTVTAPAQGAAGNLEVALQSPTPATGYRYEVVR